MIAALLLAAATPEPCKGSTTPDANACAAAGRDAALSELNRYLAAVRRRLGSAKGGIDASAATLLTGFDNAERVWDHYRKAQCDNVFAFWQGGTIRVAMELECETRLIRARTRFVWQTFLTYPDSTPPILPEPED